ncbi:MAG: DUF1570 domain-containing protein [Pirellulaceae bacterium]
MMQRQLRNYSPGQSSALHVAAPVMLSLVAFWAMLASDARAAEEISLVRDGRPHHVTGELLVEAQDGGVLLKAADGELWVIQPDEIKERRSNDKPFEPLDAEATARRLLDEFGGGFSIHQTAHYVICYNTSSAYAEWCGALYERLYRGFFTYWSNQGVELREPTWPLVALVFRDRESYAEYSRGELGDAVNSIIGYYNVRTNRVTMYDLTGVDELRQNTRRISSAAHVNAILSQPAAERTVATIVHEATHQLAYNSGLQTRYADNPFWVSEGLAVYFETPDLKSSKGWRNIGGVNRVNLIQFHKYLRRRPDDSLAAMIVNDQRFRDSKTAGDAYAEAWALNYYLLRTQPRQYADYLAKLAARGPLETVTPQQRLDEFRSIFGQDLSRLDTEFLRFMQRVR